MIRTRLLQATDERQSLPLLIKHLLHVPVKQAAEQHIVGHPDGPVCYTDFYKRVSQLAHYLKQAGLKPGDSVALIDWNSYRLPECLFAVSMSGAVLHIVNTAFTSEQMAEAVNMHEDKIVIVHSDFLTDTERVAGRLESVQEFIIASDGMPVPDNKLDAFGRYEGLTFVDAPPFEFPDFRDDSVALTSFRYEFGRLIPSSQTHHQVVAHTLARASVQENPFQLDYHDTFMPLLPCLDSVGIFEIFLATYLGVKQVYPGGNDTEDILKSIEMEGVTYSPIHSLQMYNMFDRSLIADYQLDRWRVSIKEGFLPVLSGKKSDRKS